MLQLQNVSIADSTWVTLLPVFPGLLLPPLYSSSLQICRCLKTELCCSRDILPSVWYLHPPVALTHHLFGLQCASWLWCRLTLHRRQFYGGIKEIQWFKAVFSVPSPLLSQLWIRQDSLTTKSCWLLLKWGVSFSFYCGQIDGCEFLCRSFCSHAGSCQNVCAFCS